MRTLLLTVFAALLCLQINAAPISGIDGGEKEEFFKATIPQKVDNMLKIDVTTTDQQTILMEVFNDGGKLVYTHELNLYGELTNEIDTSNYPIGTYKVEVSCKGQKVTKEVVKK